MLVLIKAVKHELKLEILLKKLMLKINFKIKIIKLRKNDKYKYILVDGTSKFNLLKNGLFEIIREYNGKKIVVYINLLNKIKNYQIPKNAKLLLSS
jgi:hypothetical protein